MSQSEQIRTYLGDSAHVLTLVADACGAAIEDAAGVLVEAFRGEGKLLLCGNGGSAADCQHMAAELVSRFSPRIERRALPAIALTTDTSFLTAFANDCGYEGVFARQVEAHGRRGDVLLAISTSGNSPNVIAAARIARQLGIAVIALTGARGALQSHADVLIAIPSADTQHIQQAHLAVEHLLCGLVENAMFGGESD